MGSPGGPPDGARFAAAPLAFPAPGRDRTCRRGRRRRSLQLEVLRQVRIQFRAVRFDLGRLSCGLGLIRGSKFLLDALRGGGS